MSKLITEEGEEYEVFEGDPDYSEPQAMNSAQDLADPQLMIQGFIGPTTHTTRQMIEWYRSHETTQELGYNPDGMCLKICREARNIPAVYPSAKVAQDATPLDHRITRVSEIKKGMVAYYDDPRDSNRFGHIVTVVGRVKNADLSSLRDVLVRTNSVKKGHVVVVRGDYFYRYWGDPFQFAAISVNGYEFPEFVAKPKPAPVTRPKPFLPLAKQGRSVRRALKNIRSAARFHSKKKHKQNQALAEELQAHAKALNATYKKYGGK